MKHDILLHLALVPLLPSFAPGPVATVGRDADGVERNVNADLAAGARAQSAAPAGQARMARGGARGPAALPLRVIEAAYRKRPCAPWPLVDLADGELDSQRQ